MGLYSSVCASNYYMDSVWVYNCTGILPEASIYPVFPSLDYSLSTYSSMSLASIEAQVDTNTRRKNNLRNSSETS